MGHQTVFQRYEIKYLLTKTQQERILAVMSDHMEGDVYGHSTICNIYFDTPTHRLIRRSLEKPVYKEKLRLRSYGIATPQAITFAELKKKYQAVVYKRRIALPEAEAMAYLTGNCRGPDSQIGREIDYFKSLYAPLSPAIMISYERDAFYATGDRDFRVTFDENILWRQEDLSLCAGVYGAPLLTSDQVLMEIKTGTAIPLWMVRALTEQQIYKTSFSKYGNAYRTLITSSGGVVHV